MESGKEKPGSVTQGKEGLRRGGASRHFPPKPYFLTRGRMEGYAPLALSALVETEICSEVHHFKKFNKDAKKPPQKNTQKATK